MGRVACLGPGGSIRDAGGQCRASVLAASLEYNSSEPLKARFLIHGTVRYLSSASDSSLVGASRQGADHLASSLQGSANPQHLASLDQLP